MTEKLYYHDSHLAEFTAVVLSCEPLKKGWGVVLDRTAFFPEGGGQLADTGTLGGARVLDAHERGGEIVHTTDAPLPVGETVTGRLDFEQRWRRMQNHSGEHILSGLVHGRFGYDNVGFHMGDDCMTIDFSGELSEEQLREAERAANEVVRRDLPIRTCFPEPQALAAMDYRSKLELTEDVRIVEIEGVDRCACCAPHVSRTGEVGLVKILDAERHRGGMRLSVVCGLDALEILDGYQQSVTEISRLLSARRGEVAAAVRRVLAERETLRVGRDALGAELIRLYAAAQAETAGNLLVFDSLLDEVAQRELVNLLMAKAGGFAAVFCGDDDGGWRYVIGSLHRDLRAGAKLINAAVGGRGGGKPQMIMGRAAASRAEIERGLADLSWE